MRILGPVQPTAEQLAILAHRKPGTLLLRGAAGSGKTTTALLRLRQQTRMWLDRREREGIERPVRVLVLTYNRTLEGYIAALARQQVADDDALELTVSTFSKWALWMVRDEHGYLDVLDSPGYKRVLSALIGRVGLDTDWAVNEVDYLMGRYRTQDLERYMTDERTGRGIAPRVEQPLRRRILDEIVYRFQQLKASKRLWDWNDIAIEGADVARDKVYDVVIIDEAQDFSANQMRAVIAHLADPHSLTIVMDAAQRIYPRSFTWKEAGIQVADTKKLTENHRNTKEIAAFARSLLEGVPLGDDGTLPDLNAAKDTGTKPVMLEGTFSDQTKWVLDYITNEVPDGESVAFLQVRGGQWFSYVRSSLNASGIEYCELTREKDWPQGPEEVALVTFHSAKGLEFDHVIMLGLNQQVTPHGPETGDGALDDLRKLVAMGIGRARKSVVLGYKASDASTLIGLFAPDTYTRKQL
jgi:superfamily I DNA/RNA helicase